MNSIEDRLAADAAQVRRDDPSAPPLDLYLDRAIGAGRRYAVQRWLAVAAVLIVVAGVATALALRSTRSSEPPASGGITLPTPHTIVRDGVMYTARLVTATGATRDSSDQNAIDIYVFDHYDAAQPKCSQLKASARIVRQTATTVEVASFSYNRTPPGMVQFCGFTSYANNPLNKRFVLKLDAPLASRTVVDVRSGKPLALLDGVATPKPRYVPAGYHQTDAQGVHLPDVLAAVRSYAHDRASLAIMSSEAADWSVDGDVLGRAAVHGRPALITSTVYGRCVAWTAPAGLEHQVCSNAKQRRELLPRAELLRVARSLQP